MGHVDVAYQKRHCHAFPCDNVCVTIYASCPFHKTKLFSFYLQISTNQGIYIGRKNSCVDTFMTNKYLSKKPKYEPLKKLLKDIFLLFLVKKIKNL